MKFVPTERALEKFKRESHCMMKKFDLEDEYYMLEPYFEEAMNQLPEERKEMFYMFFDDRLNELLIANVLNLSILDVMKELHKSIIIVLKDAQKLFIKDHGESIDEMTS